MCLSADGIRWPELNKHGADAGLGLPLPAKPTGGHGLATNAMDRDRDFFDDDEEDDYGMAPVSHAGSMVGHGGVASSSGGAGGGGGRSPYDTSDGGHDLDPFDKPLPATSSPFHHDPQQGLMGSSAFDVDRSPEMLEMTSHGPPVSAVGGGVGARGER